MQAEQLGRKNAYWLESGPCRNRNEMHNESGEDKIADAHKEVP